MLKPPQEAKHCLPVSIVKALSAVSPSLRAVFISGRSVTPAFTDVSTRLAVGGEVVLQVVFALGNLKLLTITQNFPYG